MHKPFSPKRLLLPLAVSSALTQPVQAADELLLYVFDEQEPVAGASVTVDGEVVGTTRKDGSLLVDLDGGSHLVSITDAEGDDTAVARFSNLDGQLIDIIADLDDEGAAPRVDIYSASEAAADRRNAAEGTLQIAVFQGQDPAASKIVTISGGGGAVSTNAQGIATKTLPRGLYTVSIGDVSTQVRVAGGITRGARLLLPEAEGGMQVSMPSLEEVFVIASFDPSGLEVSERDTGNIVDTIGVEALARFSDSDVAASVVRVPGISVQDNKYVFIRGLGGRYIASTLNLATMPSTNPSKRTVPLDLFPSNFVSQLDIKKTFLPYMPGESTGGNLVINTKTFPEERMGRISFSTSFAEDLSGETVFIDSLKGDYDVWGVDDGSRKQPHAVEVITDILEAREFVASDDGQTYPLTTEIAGELSRAAAILLSEGFDLRTETATPDVSFGADYGDLFYVSDAEIGFYAAVNYDNSWSMRNNGVRNSYTPTMDTLDNYRYQTYANDVEISGIFTLGMNIGESTYEWNNLISRVTSSQVERFVGQEGDEQQTVYGHNIQWEEREYISSQIVGSHIFNDAGTLFGEWQFTASRADRYAPDRRDLQFRAAGSQTDPEVLKDGFDFQALNTNQDVALQGFFVEPTSLLRRYDELTDTNFDASFDLTWDVFDNGSSYGKIQAGAQAIYRERDSETYVYGFNINQSLVDQLASPNVLVSDVLFYCNAENAVADCPEGGISNSPNTGFVFDDKTLASDSYDAELSYNSAYLMYDHTFDSTWQVILGARVESYDQTTDTFSLEGTQAAVTSEIKETSVLPSLSVNWFYSDNQQLRFALSETVARPDFKEAANATFYDMEFNVRVRGNPFLEISSIINADLRWEWYINDQDSLSVAAFYKDMDKPIERVALSASGTAGNSRTFRNAESAELYGVEIEGRKEFVLTEDYNKTLFVAFNGAWIESEVQQLTAPERPLQGQPEYTANIVLGYDDIAAGHQLTILLNENGKSIADVGLFGAPDVYLEPRLEFNIVYRYALSETANIKAKIENLLDEPVEYTQGGKVFQRYERGRAVQVGVTWEF
jgi:outer membrane receptor protein involved in Fe transport